MPELPEAIYDILRFWQHETHYLSYRHSPLHRHSLKQKRQSLKSLRLLGLGIITLSLTFAFIHPPLDPIYQFMATYKMWLVGLGAAIGLWCVLK